MSSISRRGFLETSCRLALGAAASGVVLPPLAEPAAAAPTRTPWTGAKQRLAIVGTGIRATGVAADRSIRQGGPVRIADLLGGSA